LRYSAYDWRFDLVLKLKGYWHDARQVISEPESDTVLLMAHMMQNMNSDRVFGEQTTDIVNSLYCEENYDYQEILIEVGQAFELIKEGVKLSLPLGLHLDIGGKVMAAVLGELTLKVQFVQMHDSRLIRLANRQTCYRMDSDKLD
jgi:hypothetical protein